MTKFYEALQRAGKGALTAERDSVIQRVTLPKNRLGAEIDMEEEMITLYHSIVTSLPEVDHRSVLFVGSRSNEGTSTVARQLGRTVSLRMEKDVLLMDLDRSRPDLHVYSRLNPEKEWDDGDDGDSSIEKTFSRIEDSSLYVMHLFERTIVSPGTLDAAKRKEFWETLKEKFDLIIVDSPPATLFPDGPSIVSKVDGVILVVEAEKTHWQVAKTVVEKIIKSGGNVLGMVFNKRQFYIPERIYRYL